MINRSDLIELDKALKEIEYQKKAYAKAKAEFDEKMSTTTKIIKATQDQVDKLKEKLGADALAVFEETGEKKFPGGLGIRVSEKENYLYDEKTALAFAIEKQMFLKLDKKLFEVAIPGLNVGFVTVDRVKTTQVTFPKEIKLEESDV